MAAKFKKHKSKSLQPKVILEKLDSIKTVVDGTVTFSSFEFQDVKAALESMIDFPEAAKDLNKSHLVSNAIWVAAKAQKTEESAFIKQVNLCIKKELAKRPSTYYVLTSVSISNIGLRKIELDGCLFKFYKSNFPRKFKNRKDPILARTRGVKEVKSVESIGYTKVVIETTANSEQIAVSKGLRALDQLRSLYSLFLNNVSESIGNEWEPINKIRLGEYHTVHKEDGSVYPDMLWYDPTYKYTSPASSQHIGNIVKNVKYIIGKLAKLHYAYRGVVNESLLRYVRAFDEQNQNVAVMRAWGALEGIAAPKESNCDSVTRRCAFLFDEPEYHKQILEHVREYRNRNVHAGEESNTAKIQGFQIQRYFKQLILFHVYHVGHFDKISEANAFLDMPTCHTKLLSSRKLIQKAIKFRGYDS